MESYIQPHKFFSHSCTHTCILLHYSLQMHTVEKCITRRNVFFFKYFFETLIYFRWCGQCHTLLILKAFLTNHDLQFIIRTGIFLGIYRILVEL